MAGLGLLEGDAPRTGGPDPTVRVDGDGFRRARLSAERIGEELCAARAGEGFRAAAGEGLRPERVGDGFRAARANETDRANVVTSDLAVGIARAGDAARQMGDELLPAEILVGETEPSRLPVSALPEGKDAFKPTVTLPRKAPRTATVAPSGGRRRGWDVPLSSPPA